LGGHPNRAWRFFCPVYLVRFGNLLQGVSVVVKATTVPASRNTGWVAGADAQGPFPTAPHSRSAALPANACATPPWPSSIRSRADHRSGAGYRIRGIPDPAHFVGSRGGEGASPPGAVPGSV